MEHLFVQIFYGICITLNTYEPISFLISYCETLQKHGDVFESLEVKEICERALAPMSVAFLGLMSLEYTISNKFLFLYTIHTQFHSFKVSVIESARQLLHWSFLWIWNCIIELLNWCPPLGFLAGQNPGELFWWLLFCKAFPATSLILCADLYYMCSLPAQKYFRTTKELISFWG